MRTRADFLAARGGRRLNGPFFFIETRDRGDDARPRLGLTVTKKIGNAVVRNRIRRRLREAVRTVCGADMADGFDYVIVARREVLDLAFERLTDELSRRLAKGGAAFGTGRKERQARAGEPSSGSAGD